jgi:hypothetical protein
MSISIDQLLTGSLPTSQLGTMCPQCVLALGELVKHFDNKTGGMLSDDFNHFLKHYVITTRIIGSNDTANRIINILNKNLEYYGSPIRTTFDYTTTISNEFGCSIIITNLDKPIRRATLFFEVNAVNIDDLTPIDLMHFEAVETKKRLDLATALLEKHKKAMNQMRILLFDGSDDDKKRIISMQHFMMLNCL